jgi:ribosomal protein S18 acetylase RimI-like enzyme
MNYLEKIIFHTIVLSAFFTSQCCEQASNIIVRTAINSDIIQINALLAQQYHNNFKPIWKQYYAPLFSHGKNPEALIQEKIELNEITNKKTISDQENGGNCRLIVAEQTSFDQKKKIVGYCRFEKIDLATVYVHFILVDETIRGQGIAKKLAHVMMNAFENMTKFNFRALRYNDFVNTLYTKHNCKQIGIVALDPTTGKISTDPNAPITHYDYSYTSEK